MSRWITLLLMMACSSTALDVGARRDAATSSRDASLDARRDAAPDVRPDACLADSCCTDEDCASRGVRGRCEASGCVSTGECLPAMGDCDGDPVSGCETPLTSALNCGACGVRCEAPAYCEGAQCLRDPAMSVARGVTCVLDRAGAIFCAGADWRGGLGDGALDHTATGWRRTGFGEPAVQLQDNCGLAADGRAKCWGDFDSDGVLQPRRGPRPVEGLPRLANLGTGHSWSTTCGVAQDGAAWCWGDNTSGVVDWSMPGGTGHQPQRIEGLPPVTEVVGDRINACALVEEEVWCWGSGVFGSTGLGALGAPEVHGPRRVDVPPATALAVSWAMSCSVDIDGGLWCFGQYLSFLDEPSSAGRLPPTRVPGLPPVVAVSLVERLICAVDTDGGVWCFGFEALSFLNEETRREVRFPERIITLPPPVEIGVEMSRACALSLTARELWCWGSERAGSFGTIGHSPVHATAWAPTLVYSFD